ncbi:MAG: TRAP transporter substrate-binding protein [Flavobacteriales bacterium]|jgi:tripartite ATP-independent transporter DctP family solute receptor|tara:strand:- start:3596 stop:4567 length:972 start_codon:yes stop_codon:yes gene_type:complete
MKQLLALVLILFITSCDNEKKFRVIRLGHGLDVSHSVHQAMIKADQYLNEISSGKMRIQIYPNQQLGSERECLELLQIGSLDMTKVSGAVMENFAPNMRIFGLPFLFDDKEHLFRVLDGPIGKSLLKDGEDFWLKGLGYYDSGSRSFYTRDRPITIPKDLEGLKIRVQESASAFEMVKQLGGSPTPISWGELYTSIQQGVVDAAENNPPSFYLSRHYEVCKYYSIDEHTMIPDILLVSTHLWNRLNIQEQEWLQAAIDRSVKDQRGFWTISENIALEAVIAAGVIVSYPKKEPFQKATKGMYEEFKKDSVIASLINQIQDEKN